MSRNKSFVYFVEGENEKLLINSIKNKYIESGKVRLFNPIVERIKSSHTRIYPSGTNIILVFDTDVKNEANVRILKKNIKMLEDSNNIEKVILIPQINKFEDELICSTNIKKAIDFTNSKTESEFKSDFNKLSKPNQLVSRLEKHKFSIEKFWSRNPDGIYKEFINSSSEIKL